MLWSPPALTELRTRAGEELLRRVAGPSAHHKRARIHGAPGPRWFEPGSPIRLVHADASMYVGGLAALLLQSLHPQAMAAVWAHSGFMGDPWGRLQRTSTFLAVTTFGTDQDAAQAVRRVRGVHDRIGGVTSQGEPYRASDPHLLAWVHVAEAECFLRAYQRYGRRPLNRAGQDAYVRDMALVAARLGAEEPPATRAELSARLARYRGELRSTAESRETTEYLLSHPPLPRAVRVPYALLAAAAVDLLPPWARRQLSLPLTARLLRPLAVIGGRAVVAGIRWATPPVPAAAVPDAGGALP
ncbi:oxygenase MpaB family protein [Streptomyces roseus]|uniref:oxygenase MpaB family protein n=1 Tax=Streptomyces roseus TaxID=66430 RepID=UPI00340E3C6F